MATTIRYNYGDDTTRNQPVSPELQRLLLAAGEASGIDEIVIGSGGQPAAGEGGNRTGSTRHDHGNAADFSLVVGGRTLDFSSAEDVAIFQAFVGATRANGATGVGAGANYMGTQTIHVGFGDEAVWGGTGPEADAAPDWLLAAFNGTDVPAAPLTPRTPVDGEQTAYRPSAPIDPYTDDEIEARPAGPEGYNFVEAIGASISSDWSLSWAIREMGGGAVDPDFEWDLTSFTEAVKDTPEEYHDFVYDAHSSEDAQRRMRMVQEDLVREQRLAASGMTGFGARLASAFMDPIALAASVATAGAAAPLMAAASMSRAGRLFTTALVSGAGNAAAESAVGALNPKIDTDDIIMAFGIGAVLGGVIGALRKNPATRAEADAMVAMGRTLAAPTAPKHSVVGGGAGATTPGERPYLLGDTPNLDESGVPVAVGGAVRFDAGGQLGSSQSPIARLLGPHFGEEAVGTKGHEVVPDAATTVQRIIHGRYVRDWQTVAYPAFKAWAQERNLFSPRKKGRAWDQFNREIADFVEDTAPAVDVSKHVSGAANEFRRVMREYQELLNNPRRDKGGVGRPISEIGPDPHYIAKYADHEAINTHLERFEWETLRNFVRQAIFARKADIDADMADRMAEGWLRNITKAGYGMEDGASLALSRGDREAFKEAFANGNAASHLTDEDVARIFDDLEGLGRTADDGNSGFARTKRRTLMDYRFEAEIRGRDGAMHKLSMKDFFIRDADFVLNRYSRQTSGRVALSQMEIRDPKSNALLIDGIRTKVEFEKVLDWVRDDWQKRHGLSFAEKKSGADLDTANLKYLWDSVTGTPHYNTTNKVYEWMRRLREFNFIRLMNRMGIAQSQEFSRMLGTLGVKAMFQHIPSLRRIAKDGRSVPRDRIQQELEAATGKGTEMDFGRHRYRYEDELIGTAGFGKAGRGIDRMLEKGKRLTANVSLMTHIHSIQQKWTMRAVSQRLYDFARQTSTGADFDLSRLRGANLNKLRAIGMSDADLKGVFAALLKHGETPSGSKLAALNMDQWEPAVRSRFVNTLTRWTDRIIHQNDQATLSRWMSQPVVQMMTQFRSFVIGSWAKSTLYNLHNFDARTFATMMLELMAAAGTWLLTRASTGQLTEDDLDPATLARAAFGRAAFMSIVPMGVDTATTFTPLGPLFQFRTSGAPTDFLLGNPSADFIDTISKFASGLSDAAVNGETPSAATMQQGVRSLPFGNFVPFTGALSLMID